VYVEPIKAGWNTDAVFFQEKKTIPTKFRWYIVLAPKDVKLTLFNNLVFYLLYLALLEETTGTTIEDLNTDARTFNKM
jgi:hypothetical protein